MSETKILGIECGCSDCKSVGACIAHDEVKRLQEVAVEHIRQHLDRVAALTRQLENASNVAVQACAKVLELDGRLEAQHDRIQKLERVAEAANAMRMMKDPPCNCEDIQMEHVKLNQALAALDASNDSPTHGDAGAPEENATHAKTK